MTKTPPNKASSKDFRGLTIFELLAILAVISISIAWALSFKGKLENKAFDEIRKSRVSTLKENLKTIYLQTGSFPSSEQFDDEATRKKLFPAFLADQGKDSMNDPKDKGLLISYISDPEGCTGNLENPCTKVALSLILSNGEEFVKFAFEPGKELEYLDEAIKSGEVNTEELVESVQPKEVLGQ